MTAIAKKSPFTGNVNTLEVPLPEEELFAWLDADPRIRPKVQEAFPTLDAGICEFLLNGITPEEWADAIGEEE